MTLSAIQARPSEKGFTLVELAIVMIIIGLLIGGILKGQELINNARVSSTVAQAKAVESGISAFRDKYASFPGDMGTPTTRLPNCTVGLCLVAAAVGTLNNGVIENTGPALDPGLAVGGTTESGLAFIHLGAAGMIGGVQPSTAAVGAGASNPVTPLGGAWTLGSSAGTATGVILPAGLVAGVYIETTPAIGAAVPATSAQIMTPIQAANIDRKLDDGQPNTGIVRAVGLAAGGATACTNVATAAAVYNESVGGSVCGVVAKVQ
jgi:prepilin-type N-terminal cleavage/methylation domain-containing protein